MYLNLNWIGCGFVIGCLLQGATAVLNAASAAEFAYDTSREPTSIALKLGNRPVLKYLFAHTQYKPYVSELYTTRGFNVLRDAPFDHHHHHALMYGIRVNGVNFWEETSGSGVQRVISTEPPSFSSVQGRPCAVIRQELHWLAAQDAFLPLNRRTPLLVEHRTLTVTVDEKAAETAVLWRSAFEVPGKTNEVTLAGANYHGLGMRFLAELDRVSLHLSPSGNPDVANNHDVVEQHPWQAVLFGTPGNPATVAMFGAPANVRGEPFFFAMTNHFAYLAATQRLDKEPLVYKSGDRFEIGYLVTLYPDLKSKEALSARWEEFKTLGR